MGPIIFPTRTSNHFTVRCGRCINFLGEADVFRGNGSEEIGVWFTVDASFVHKRDKKGEFWEIPATSQRDKARLKSPVAHYDRTGSGQVDLPPNTREDRPIYFRKFDTQFPNQRMVRMRCANCRNLTTVALLDTVFTSRYIEE